MFILELLAFFKLNFFESDHKIVLNEVLYDDSTEQLTFDIGFPYQNETVLAKIFITNLEAEHLLKLISQTNYPAEKYDHQTEIILKHFLEKNQHQVHLDRCYTYFEELIEEFVFLEKNKSVLMEAKQRQKFFTSPLQRSSHHKLEIFFDYFQLFICLGCSPNKLHSKRNMTLSDLLICRYINSRKASFSLMLLLKSCGTKFLEANKEFPQKPRLGTFLDNLYHISAAGPAASDLQLLCKNEALQEEKLSTSLLNSLFNRMFLTVHSKSTDFRFLELWTMTEIVFLILELCSIDSRNKSLNNVGLFFCKNKTSPYIKFLHMFANYIGIRKQYIPCSLVCMDNCCFPEGEKILSLQEIAVNSVNNTLTEMAISNNQYVFQLIEGIEYPRKLKKQILFPFCHEELLEEKEKRESVQEALLYEILRSLCIKVSCEKNIRNCLAL